MAQITLGGNPIETIGSLPKIGDKAPDFKLTTKDLSDKTLGDYQGNRLVLNIFPSIDTSTCAQSVRTFNKRASEFDNTKVLCISKDLPFAMDRFCGAEGLDDVESLSDYKTGHFGDSYGLTIKNSVLETLHSRCVVVLDTNGTVLHAEQVGEIADEPNYEAALSVLK